MACSSDDDEKDNKSVNYITLDEIKPISLNSEFSTKSVTLSKNITDIASVDIRDYNSDFIRNIKTSMKDGKTVIQFEVGGNITYAKGYREGYIDIRQKDKVIGTATIYQARPSQALTKLAWATSDASYSETDMKDLNISDGIEMTKFIYNLETTTNGKDSYKNYPAFAYCIEMNHDPANSMEWHLPSDEEMHNALKEKGWNYFGFKEYWSSTNFDYRAIDCYFSDNKIQTMSKNNSKKGLRNVFAVK